MRVDQSGWMSGVLRWRPWARRSFEVSPSLMARFSHELRTALTGIVGYAEFLETGSNESMVSFTAKIIRESGQSLTQVSNAYFDLERLSRGDVRLACTRFVFSDVLREVVKSHQPTALEQDVRLSFSCADNALQASISTDVDRMRQVMDALVQGVVEVMGQWGAVHVALAQDETTRTWAVTWELTDVSDTEGALTLFQSFWSDDAYLFKLQEGPGVVLASAKAMLEFLGGEAKFQGASKANAPRLVVTFSSL